MNKVPLPVGLTDVCGEGGSGKTQLALSLCVQCALRGQRAIYICAQGEGPILSRLKQLTGNDYAILNKILTRKIHSIEELMDFVKKGLVEMVCKNYTSGSTSTSDDDIGIVVIDSIGGLFRNESNENILLESSSSVDNYASGRSSKEHVRRSGILFYIAAKLKKLSLQYKMHIVTINQVSASFGKCVSGHHVIAALGMAWSNCVNARVLLERKETIERFDQQRESPGTTARHGYSESETRDSLSCRSDRGNNSGAIGKTMFRRYLHIILSSHLPQISVEYRIYTEGVKVVPA